MNDRNPSPQPAPRLERQSVIDRLCDAYASDQIDMAELERRLDLANRAATPRELSDLLSGLQIEPTAVAPVNQGNARGGMPVSGPPVVAPAGAIGWSTTDPARVPERQFNLAIWSGRARKGSWIPAQHITAFAFMGGVELDFREALFGTSVVEVTALAVMGGVEIIVPPGVHVEASGFALMGAFEDAADARTAPGAGAPTIRINGFAAMGGVEVTVRHPGESSRQATRRLKEERRRALESGERR